MTWVSVWQILHNPFFLKKIIQHNNYTRHYNAAVFLVKLCIIYNKLICFLQPHYVDKFDGELMLFDGDDDFNYELYKWFDIAF